MKHSNPADFIDTRRRRPWVAGFVEPKSGDEFFSIALLGIEGIPISLGVFKTRAAAARAIADCHRELYLDESPSYIN
jgi:hypothetical protein